MQSINKQSFSAADTIPGKLLANEGVIDYVKARKILPYHVQINPTNRCSLKCSFCSCANRDKTVEMDWKLCSNVVEGFHALGAKAFTITGGGGI